MARELGDVLHYFVPEATPPTRTEIQEARLVAVPLAPRDVVRAALVWNLAVELARQGAAVSLVAPATVTCAPWPAPGRGPLGLEVVETEMKGLDDFARCAALAAQRAATRSGATPLTLAAVPAEWLRNGAGGAGLLRWVLVLARPEERELHDTWAVMEAVATQAPTARIGACVFGVRSLSDARHAFEGLAALAEIELARALVSYGVLIDDVHLSRSIVARRPIALAQPASPSARALADVASMLIEDAQTDAALEP